MGQAADRKLLRSVREERGQKAVNDFPEMIPGVCVCVCVFLSDRQTDRHRDRKKNVQTRQRKRRQRENVLTHAHMWPRSFLVGNN